jgi:hypothetical protein
LREPEAFDRESAEQTRREVLAAGA